MRHEINDVKILFGRPARRYAMIVCARWDQKRRVRYAVGMHQPGLAAARIARHGEAAGESAETPFGVRGERIVLERVDPRAQTVLWTLPGTKESKPHSIRPENT